MNNKRIGTAFENEVCGWFKQMGAWVHFISPDSSTGKQPFDVIAVRGGIAYAIDCKTCVDRYFRISRAEENQLLAFEKWLKCGNENAWFVVKHQGWAYVVPYTTLVKEQKIDLEAENARRLFKCSL